MSGSSRAAISGVGWVLLLDSGLSISWSNPAAGAAKHRADEDRYRTTLEEVRPLVEALLGRHGEVGVGDIDGAALCMFADDFVGWKSNRKLELPCTIELRAGKRRSWTLRIVVHNTTVAALLALLNDAKAMLDGMSSSHDGG